MIKSNKELLALPVFHHLLDRHTYADPNAFNGRVRVYNSAGVQDGIVVDLSSPKAWCHADPGTGEPCYKNRFDDLGPFYGADVRQWSRAKLGDEWFYIDLEGNIVPPEIVNRWYRELTSNVVELRAAR